MGFGVGWLGILRARGVDVDTDSVMMIEAVIRVPQKSYRAGAYLEISDFFACLSLKHAN